MTTLDFYVTDITGATDITLITEKQVVEGNRLPSLDTVLSNLEVNNIGEIIERLESIPYRAGKIISTSRLGKLTIVQPR